MKETNLRSKETDDKNMNCVNKTTLPTVTRITRIFLVEHFSFKDSWISSLPRPRYHLSTGLNCQKYSLVSVPLHLRFEGAKEVIFQAFRKIWDAAEVLVVIVELVLRMLALDKIWK
ncbi:UNVERIFIED_CONTAM: hypothetical protein K2H54_008425 [Gekko kuhli]